MGVTDVLEYRSRFSHSQLQIARVSSMLCYGPGRDRRFLGPSREPIVRLIDCFPPFTRVSPDAGLRTSRLDLRPALTPSVLPWLCTQFHTGHGGCEGSSPLLGREARFLFLRSLALLVLASARLCIDVRLRRAAVIAAARRRLGFAIDPDIPPSRSSRPHTGSPRVSLAWLHDPSPPGDPIGSIHSLSSRRRT